MGFQLIRQILIASTIASCLATVALAQEQPRSAAPITPAKIAEVIVNACKEGRYADIEGYMHAEMLYNWSQLGLDPKGMCDGITRNGTLKSVTVAAEQQLRDGDYAPVILTYTYTDGSEVSDRMIFFRDKGIWRLIG